MPVLHSTTTNGPRLPTHRVRPTSDGQIGRPRLVSGPQPPVGKVAFGHRRGARALYLGG